jgi:hypothetical protein
VIDSGRRMLCRLGLPAVLAVLAGGALAASPAVGAGWSIQPTPPPATSPGGEDLFGVSCASRITCTAGGSISVDGTPAVPLGATWNGASWSVAPAVDEGGDQGSPLLGISCASPDQCIAVGYDQFNGGPILPIAESWDGMAWTLQSVELPSDPPPFGTLDELNAVSCASATDCMAVGNDATGTGEPLAEQWNGTSWQIEDTAIPPSGGGDLTGVSCASVTSCTAVGSDGAGALAETWNGSTWAIDPTPNPVGGFDAGLTAVSCPAARQCTAVGSYTATGGAPTLTLAEGLRAGRWEIENTPSPAAVTYSTLAGVSCPSVRSCTAVGSDGDSGDLLSTLAERLHRGRWAIEPTPNAAGATDSLLTAVSCPSRRACTAVGSSNDNYAGDNTLVERYSGGAARWKAGHHPRHHPPYRRWRWGTRRTGSRGL